MYNLYDCKTIHYILFLFNQVKIWFQNRRMKWRNSKERELLSVGGSREQTLPSKDNQNPDLSDPLDPGIRDADIGDTQGRTQSR